MAAPTLRPGYLEAEDIRSALDEHARDAAALAALTAAFLADAATVEALNRANGEVADAELAAYQRANDRLAALVEAFLAKRAR
jgi:hypothetical protein